MDERVQISMLLDLYGELLTDKQRNIMNLYFNEDLSLGEISELNNTSRQAIHDIIKRCHKLLIGYDSKLGLLEKEDSYNNRKKLALKELTALKEYINDEKQLKLLEKIKTDISNL